MFEHVLRDRVAIVTGAESGIGAACAKALAAAGAHIAGTYLHDEASVGQTLSGVRAYGRHAIALRTDVTQEHDVARLFDAAHEDLGQPDILVNAAGVNMSGVSVADMSAAQWRARIDTDLTGCFFTCRRLVQALREAGSGGVIINISSIHATAMRAGGAAYDAAKGGLLNLTRTLALETAADAIRVNAIAPGMVLTPMNERALHDEAFRQTLEAKIPMKRAGKAEEVADVAVFLASPAGAYITGSTITIDGGLSLLMAQGA